MKNHDGYYDRQGNPLTPEQWGKLFSDDLGPDARMKYKRVASTVLPNGLWISTVWLGRDHAFGDGPPLIFETMVFPSEESYAEQDMERYSTEAEAMAGHQRMVEKWGRQ